jgi:signal transduction histidine kinase/ligand-binding sensor domain-containing protein
MKAKGLPIYFLLLTLPASDGVAILSVRGAGQTTPAQGAMADDAYLQTVWTTEEGLPQNSVNSIVQTRDGYLWLATFGGLVRFDGVRFTIFNTSNTPGLKSDRLTTLCEGRAGNLWIGAESGGLLISLQDGVARAYTTADGLLGGLVRRLHEDREGTLWIGTTNGLARFQAGRFTSFTKENGLPGQGVQAICEDRDGRLFLSTPEAFAEFRDGQFIVHTPPDGLTPQTNIYAGSDGRIWLRTKSGLASYGAGRFAVYPLPADLAARRADALLVDRAGDVWLGFPESNTLARLNTATGGIARYTPPVNLSGNYLSTLLQDREGNLWLGSRGGGLHRFKPRKVTAYTTEHGLPHNDINAFAGDGAGGVWISAAGGLAHFESGRFTAYTPREGLRDAGVFGLLRDRGGTLWFGNNGLASFKDGVFTRHDDWQELAGLPINTFAEDSQGNLWIGTGQGLHRLREGKITVLRQADGLAHDALRYILPARDGSLWLGTVGGLSHLRAGRFTNYTTKEGLANNLIRCLLEEPDGTLWIGSYGGGLTRLRAGRLAPITTRHGLFDDFISSILSDDQGNFWLLGNRGIFRVSRQELHDFADGRRASITSTSYGVADGMKSGEGDGGIQPAGWKAADGKLWFATIDGVAVIDPRQTDSTPAPVYLERVLLDQQPLPLAASAAVRIEPGQGNLEIQYVGLSFSRPEQVKYKYQLEGLDEAWTDAGARRTAYYPYLPPGAYTFHVIAANGDGVWNTEGKSLRIIVLPPFYRTWWFLTLAGLGVAGAIWLSYEYRVRQLQRAQARQQAFARQLIESQENERRRIAVELHDSLGQSLVIIRNWALLGAGQLDAQAPAKEELDEITATAARAINEVREIAYNLGPYHLERLGLAGTIKDMVNRVAQASQIRFTTELDSTDGALSREAEMNLYRIAQESINNIVKHAGATEVKITLKREAGSVKLIVADNGKGFDPQLAASPAGKSGFGLTGIAERVRLLEGAWAVRSVIGEGTIVEVTLNGAGSDRKM